MNEKDIVEQHIEEEIYRYERQIAGIQYRLALKKMVLDRIRKGILFPNVNRKIEQLNLFGT